MLKKSLLALGAAVAAVGAVHIGAALSHDRTTEHTHINILSNKISENLVGLKIAFVTDVHFCSDKMLSEAVTQINKEKPDLLLLGGDFAEPQDILERQLKILSGVETTFGIYGVDGNHDKADILSKLMKENGMTMLDNSGVKILDKLYICGVQDIRRRKPDVKKATAKAEDNDFVLMLSHNPDLAERHDVSRMDLVLCGHTHGGQMAVFGKFAPALYIVSDYGQKYIGGAVLEKDKRVYTSRGMGNHRHMFRVFARPQVVYFTFRKEM